MHLDNLLCQIQADHCNLVHDFPSHPIDDPTSILALRCRLELGKSFPFAQADRSPAGSGVIGLLQERLPPSSKDDAKGFFTRLAEHLNATIPTSPDVQANIAGAVQRAREAARGTVERRSSFAEGAFLNTYIIRQVHTFLTSELGSAEKARLALLSESYKGHPQLTSGSPVRPGPHPFRKVMAASPRQIMNIWRGRVPGLKPLALNSCPDMALRAPVRHRTVFEAKYHNNNSTAIAEAELVKNIYQAFWYLGLPRLAETSTHAAWDYEFACVLVYDATRDAVMLRAWESLPSKVRAACWSGANVYVMILRGSPNAASM
jgi:hypothetical protein